MNEGEENLEDPIRWGLGRRQYSLKMEES